MTKAADRPTVSVIIPTFNRPAMLDRAVRTVLRQSASDFELFIVDDGSPDATRTTMERFADPRIETIYNGRAGVSAARNAGLTRARGEWIAFLDDDNEWMPEYLERQLEVAKRFPPAGAVYCVAECRDESSGTVRFTPLTRPHGGAFDELLIGWFPAMSAMMIRRSLIVEVGGFSRELEALEDLDLLMRVALRTDFIENPGTFVVRHEHSGERLGVGIERRRRNFEILDRRWRREIKSRRGHLAYARWLRHRVAREELRAMYAALASEGRRAAARTVIRLGRRLPWSSPSIVRPFAIMIAGPERYQALSTRLRHRWPVAT